MGWRNMFINLKNTSINRIMEFVNHHNDWNNHFSDDEIKKMEENDEVPGETLQIDVIINDNNEYWAYLGNHGGSSWTESWGEKYFNDIEIFNSSTFKHYNDDWQSWNLISVEEYKKLNI